MSLTGAQRRVLRDAAEAGWLQLRGKGSMVVDNPVHQDRFYLPRTTFPLFRQGLLEYVAGGEGGRIGLTPKGRKLLGLDDQ